MGWNLERFKRAQCDSYEQALREIRSSRKRSHWMWYIFPQLRGLGFSSTAEYYGISTLDEAKAYLEDPVLGPRLAEISQVLLELDDKNADRIFGYPDNLKLRSCMTLFAAAAGRDSVFQKVLDAYFNGVGDPRTTEML